MHGRARRPIAALLLAAVSLAAGARADSAVPAVRTGLERLEQQVQEFTLPNGLRFIVVERHQAPVFSFFTVVNSGSANDQTGTTGIAHMMEHMAFKGTSRLGTSDYAKERPAMDAEESAWNALLAERRRGARADTAQLRRLEQAFADAQTAAETFVVSNEYSRLIEQAGGQNLNAFTSQDITAYFYSLPSNRLELWAASFAGTLVDPVFREFYKERDVVYEERRMRVESSPEGRLYYEWMTTAFNAHPYGFGLIGIPSDLKSFTRTQGEAFFRANYVARNLTIAVVGDVTLAEVRRLAEKYFSAVPDAPPPHPLDTVEPPQIAERRVLLEDAAQPLVLVGWHIPAASDPSYGACKAAADLLGGGNWSRLYRALVKERRLAVQAFAGTGDPGEKYPNLFELYLVPASGQTAETVERAAYEVIDDALGTHPFTDEELRGYQVRVRAQKLAAVESNGDLSGELAQAQAIYGDWRAFFREQERIQALTPAALEAVLHAAIRPGNRTVGLIRNPPATAPETGAR